MIIKRRSAVAIFLAFVLVLTGQSMAIARTSMGATGQMVLCVGDGSVVVYMDETGAPTLAPHFCPDCTLNFMDMVAGDPTTLPLSEAEIHFVSMAYEATIIAAAPFAYLSRAPPAWS
jgi:hypothetical protein